MQNSKSREGRGQVMPTKSERAALIRKTKEQALEGNAVASLALSNLMLSDSLVKQLSQFDVEVSR